MKKIIVAIFLNLSSFVYANVHTVVSILPQKTFVKAIGGDKIDVALMVKPGSSPHSYEPKPSQMRDIAKADIYFSIGVEFENIWLKKFAYQNEKMKIVNIAKNIKKMNISAHHHNKEHKDEHHEDKNNKHKRKDPHVWTSPANVKIIVQDIYTQLVKIDKENKLYYKNNFDKFISYIDKVDNHIKNILVNIPKNSKFMVFHPAWGYFAYQYNLEQLPIEIEGKSPKPKALTYIIKEAKKQNVKAIFTQPEFSNKVAKTIAEELNIKVIKTSPLSPQWGKNLIKLANAIANK